MRIMSTEYEMSETQLDQALAANERLMQALENSTEANQRMKRFITVAAVLYLICTLLVVAVIGVMATGITVSIETENSTVEQDTQNGGGNNVYLPGYSATYNEGGDN